MDARLIGHFALGGLCAPAGGRRIIGFVKAGSRPSLIAGLGERGGRRPGAGADDPRPPRSPGTLTTDSGPVNGYILGLILSVALIAMFGVRYRKTGKFMPSGMLLAVSVVMIGLMAWAIWGHR